MGTSTLVKLSIFFYQSEIWEGNYDSHTVITFTVSKLKKKTKKTKKPKNPRDLNDLSKDKYKID